MVEGKVGERKQRSDKKVDVKPTISLTLKKQLYQFAELCNEPVKDIAERLCMEGLSSYPVIDVITKWLRRNYYYNRTIAIGRMERPKLKITTKDDTGKVTMRFKSDGYDKLCELAYALDIPPTSSAAVLIRVTTKSKEFMDKFVEGLGKVDDEQRAIVRRFVATYWIH